VLILFLQEKDTLPICVSGTLQGIKEVFCLSR